MNIRKIIVVSFLAFFLMFLLGASGAAARNFALARIAGQTLQENARAVQQETPPAQGAGLPGADDAIREALQRSVEQNQALILGFQIFDVVIDHIQYSQDGSVGLLWLGLRERDTGQVVESEPGLSIATIQANAAPDDASSWSILLQETPAFTEQLRALPPELLTSDIRDRFLDSPAEFKMEAVASVLSGYKLPWTAGLSKRITNSIGHVYSVAGGLTSCPTTCRYAFDFADGTMFPLIAAKGGRVKAAKWSCTNGDTNCTNWLVLEDESTFPTSYQIYHHLANNSIPQRLRTVGAQVTQGEFIGDTDDTGFSTGHHLHFHVYTTPSRVDWTWGNSVDITFDDVAQNGGRPRTCAEASEYPNLGSQCNTNNLYTSGNTPANPPSGSLDSPADRLLIRSRTVRVQGSASDDIQITRILVVANYDGTWKTIDEIAPAGNGPYSKDVDLCAANVPEGPLSLTVRIYDREGSLAPGIPVRQLIKNFSCSGTIQPQVVPACSPAANEVALYANPDFGGACQKFVVNNSQGYASDTFGALGSNNAASIQVGSSVMAILYDRSSDTNIARPLGRVETLYTSDASLGDNPIGNNHVSGLRVVSSTAQPFQPFINPVGNRLTGNNPTSIDSLVLSWEGGGGAAAFDVSLTGPGNSLNRTVTGNSTSVGTLVPGNYTLSVVARNANGSNTSSLNFSVASASLPGATALSVPFSDNMEAGPGAWVASGFWRRGSIEIGGRGLTQAWIYNNGTNYASDPWRAGDLTSAPVNLPAGSPSYLRFSSFMDTEDGEVHWDQRRVQISVNNGPFQDLVQLSDDKQLGQVWLNSGPISLQPFAGSTIRLRFHFDTVDEDNNDGIGWMIDDVSISTTAPNTACADTNNTPETAQAVTLGSLVPAFICPEGDLDYYRFNAIAGQPIVVDINARTLDPPSKLDSLVQLIDADGRSVIFENDDEQYGTLQDSLLSYVVQRTGVYYIKVKAWNHPGVGGADFPYQMDLRSNAPVPPQNVRILYPTSRMTPAGLFTISAAAADFDGGSVASMDFYWHGPDRNQGWIKLGSDTNGSDGWNFTVNPALYGNVLGSALYVQAVSRTGGVLGTVIWDLEPDLTAPVSQMGPLLAQVNSTVVKLSWTASDSSNDIDRYEIQYQVSSGGAFSVWQNWQTAPRGDLRAAWFTGAPGSSYRFRMRAIDRAGNAEAFPANFEAETRLASTCTPDANELGQTSEKLVLLVQGSSSPIFNFCKSAQDGTEDVDWVALDAKANEELLLMFLPRGSGTRLRMSIYNGQSQLLGTWLASDHEYAVVRRFRAPAAGRYYIEVKPAQPGQFGTTMSYQAWFGEGQTLYFPVMHR